MLSPQLRQQVRNLWTSFWSAGLTNPLVAVEQITYLLFLRQLEKLDRDRFAQNLPSIYPDGVEDLRRWSRFNNLPENELPRHLTEIVFPWLRGLQAHLQGFAAGTTQVPSLAARDIRPSTPQSDLLSRTAGHLEDAFWVLDPAKTATLRSAITAIDTLFAAIDGRSVNADIMGDVFEHLLDEIQSSGKNGQFRTPRHVIRFVIELLDPPLRDGFRVLDPACGTGGFLINTLLHWTRRATPPENVVLEWDGSPHHLASGDTEIQQRLARAQLCGFDNDRTMIRIAWMNLIVHGIPLPLVERRDSLSKSLDASASGTYDLILANPPFTGQVDEKDLSDLRSRFPAKAARGKAAGLPITNKSELLFVYLILDLLKPGGRAAVIIPDGVLFGATSAHIDLRRRLLFDNTVEAVISLPAGVFLPYAGVKTSIVVFQKGGLALEPGKEPRTREVWFYDVEDEAFSLDQKRTARPQGPNDLWDALSKFPGRDVSAAYYQPVFTRQRWRTVDAALVKLFSEVRSVTGQQGQTLTIWEIFPELPKDLAQAEAHVPAQIRHLLSDLFHNLEIDAIAEAEKHKPDERSAAAKKFYEKAKKSLWSRLSRASGEVLDRDFGQHGLQALRAHFDGEGAGFGEGLPQAITGHYTTFEHVSLEGGEAGVFQAILRQMAKLDGYDVWVRSAETPDQKAKKFAADPDAPDGKRPIPEIRSWRVAVRSWAEADAWPSGKDGEPDLAQPSHEGGVVRADYIAHLATLGAFHPQDANVTDAFRERLDPGCIEAADFNLSAARHRPASDVAEVHRSPAEIVGELRGHHQNILSALDRLLEKIGGA
jgi:type I restriction enzyme M protein